MMSYYDLRKLTLQIVSVIYDKKIEATRAKTQMNLYSTVVPPEELQLEYAIAKSSYNEAKKDLVDIENMITLFYP